MEHTTTAAPETRTLNWLGWPLPPIPDDMPLHCLECGAPGSCCCSPDPDGAA